MLSAVVDGVRRRKNLVVGLRSAARHTRGATPHEVVARKGPARLRAYRPAAVAEGAAPVLLITPIINRFRVVDLLPSDPETGEPRSLVASLVARGIPVYVVDWGEPRRVDRHTSFGDYVLRDLPALRSAIHADRVDVLGYCLGGTIATMYAARFPEQVRRLVTIAAPVDFRTDAPHMGLLKRWVEPAGFPVRALTAAFGNMPGRLVQQGFLWPTPLGSGLKFPRAWRRFTSPVFAEVFCLLESWNQDAVDIPGAAYRELIGGLYRDNQLARGAFRLRPSEAPVDLARIEAPLLVVTCARDTTCPPEAATALLELSSSRRGEHLEIPGGHVLPVVGPKAAARLHPQLADWLLA